MAREPSSSDRSPQRPSRPSIKKFDGRPPRPMNAKALALQLLSSTKGRCSREEGTCSHAAASPNLRYLPCACPRTCINSAKNPPSPWRNPRGVRISSITQQPTGLRTSYFRRSFIIPSDTVSNHAILKRFSIRATIFPPITKLRRKRNTSFSGAAVSITLSILMPQPPNSLTNLAIIISNSSKVDFGGK